MNKLGNRDYIVLVADVLVSVYGSQLKENGIDIRMARAVINKLREFLFFHPMDMTIKEFSKWKKERQIVKREMDNKQYERFYLIIEKLFYGVSNRIRKPMYN